MGSPIETQDAIVVGAGPAGLAAARELSVRGLSCVVLEAGAAVGWSWRRFYDSLVLHTASRLSALPGLPFGRGVPQFVPRSRFIEYLEGYVRRFDLRVRTGTNVQRVERAGDGWRVSWAGGSLDAPSVVVATGIAANPVRPAIPGIEAFPGCILHSIDYRSPADLCKGRVLVIGAGNSGAEIAAELGAAAFPTTISIRSGVAVVPRDIAGIPSQYLGLLIRRLPSPLARFIVGVALRVRERRSGPSLLPQGGTSPLDVIPLVGFHLPDAVAAGRVQVRPGVDVFDGGTARFANGTHEAFDIVILATGFRPALQCLAGVVRLDHRGFALRSDRVTSADAPGLFFVGHNYDASGGLFNIRRDAPLVADAVLARSRRR